MITNTRKHRQRKAKTSAPESGEIRQNFLAQYATNGSELRFVQSVTKEDTQSTNTAVFRFKNLGPVVQSIFSLTSPFMVKMLTVLVSTISNS